MKRFIVFVAALLLSVSAFAGVVTKSQAENVAKNVLGTSNVQYVWNGLGDKVYGDVHPAFYVFDGNGQWAIIAADDCATPVLMHGEGTFNPDNLPDNMKSLLGEVEYNIFAARNQGLAQDPEIKQAWTAYSVMTKAGSSTPVEYLVIDKDGNAGTALWNQSSPYNAKCPEIANQSLWTQYNNEGHCYAGCVAAAMAIIMRFHQWPEMGVGTISGYTSTSYGYTIPSIDISNYEYHWADLPTSDAWDSFYYTSINDWNDDQFDEVADIIYQCGAMVQMDYGYNGSGAVTSNALTAMVEHMSYSPSAVSLSRSSYTNQQWFNMIKAELVKNHPLIYHGQNKYANSGHAFVCDGYNSINEIHINWGWGGSYNGWFAVCYLGEVGGEGTAVYSRSDGAFFGLVPATGTEPSGGGSGIGFADSSNATGGLMITSGSIAKGSDFTVLATTIKSTGPASYSGSVNIGLIDKSGAVKEIIGVYASYSKDYTISDLEPGWYYSNKSFNCKITSDIAFGDRVCLCYTDSSGKWTPSSTSYTRNSNGGQVIGSISAVDFTILELPSSVSAGQVLYPGMSLGQKVPSSVTWYLDGEVFTAEYIKMEETGDHTFKVVITYTDGSTETIVKKVTVE